jgi:DNA replication and repair protein RecF
LTVPLAFRRLTVRDFRNVAALDVEPSPRFNVISGDNGQGKTSLLEALYFVATTRSFRADTLMEMIRHGAPSAHVRACIDEGGLSREHRAALTPKARSILVDGKRPSRLSAYATRTPIVVFHPGDLEIVSGPASGRRRLLDRVALFVDPTSADHRQRYEKAQRSRQAALEARGVAAPELDVFEQLMAEHGAALTTARRSTAEHLRAALLPAFSRMLAGELPLEAQYQPAGTEDPGRFAEELAQRRRQDGRRGSASFGPHRDDLVLDLDGRAARRYASQGQQRVLTLALKTAELDCVRHARRAEPVLLLDDVSSELDPTRTGAVFDFLRGTASQIFVTTTRPELFQTPDASRGERIDWTLRSGALAPS